MKRILICICLLCNVIGINAQAILVGTDAGLFDISGIPHQIFSGVSIYNIEKSDGSYFFLTDKGIMKSTDLKHYTFVSESLPKKTLKLETSGSFQLVKKHQRLKDIAFHPENPNIFVTATNSAVFLTENGGKTWQNLGTYGNANGIKAVAVATLPDKNGIDRLTVFVGTSVYGLAWKQPEVSSLWYDANTGLAKGPESTDEVSDIIIHRNKNGTIEIFFAQTFKGRLYKLNWKHKIAVLIPSYDSSVDNATYLDSLNFSSNLLFGIKEDEVFAVPVLLPQIFPNSFVKELSKNITKTLTSAKLKASGIFDTLHCAYIPKETFQLTEDISLKELFALRLHEMRHEYVELADKKKAIYIPWNRVSELDSYLNIIEKNYLNAIVIDMKDDFGYVRYNSTEPSITKVGAVRKNIILEDFIEKTKEKGVYLIARLVVFKDQQLYNYGGGIYSVKDYTTGGSWRGYDINDDGSRDYYYEYWVDPYNEEVWKYNCAIANELVRRGFDEIQFDYIRFPTDGDNLGNAYYPAKQAELDKEAAIMSFLAYARQHIQAPISIDIYGANGWYRTGARTGQDVEMLMDYVDVICPMYYPSHFSQSFLDYAPRQDRPYRIYYQGSYRAKYIARNKTIIRPWAQCFFINVSYDRQFYGPYYIKSQVTALHDAIDEGFSFWNTVGNYSALPQLDNN